MANNKIHPRITEKKKNFYFTQLECELNNMEKIISFASRKPENKPHLKFIEEYKSIIREHKTKITQSFETLSSISPDLTVFINKNIDSIFEEGFSLSPYSFYFSYTYSSYIFFTPLFKDDYYDMDAYGLFTYKYTNDLFKLDEISIGFNNDTIKILSDSPRQLLEKIDSMNTANTVDEVLNIFNNCNDEIKKLFSISETNEYIKFKDESFKKIFGFEPNEIIQKNSMNKDKNIIRLQLEQHADNLSPTLIELIKTENRILKFKEKDSSDISDKEMLLKDLKINQEELDRLMSYINQDYLN